MAIVEKFKSSLWCPIKINPVNKTTTLPTDVAPQFLYNGNWSWVECNLSEIIIMCDFKCSMSSIWNHKYDFRPKLHHPKLGCPKSQNARNPEYRNAGMLECRKTRPGNPKTRNDFSRRQKSLVSSGFDFKPLTFLAQGLKS